MMQTVKTTINEKALSEFNAKLVTYQVGACSYTSNYVLPPKSIVPVKMPGVVGLRKISITLDVKGDSESDIALAISNLTSELMKEANLVLPDGFFYHCVFTKASTPEEKAPWIKRVGFEMNGYRHGPLETENITDGSVVEVKGNFEAPVRYIITPGTDTSITVNGINVSNVYSEVVIDGMKSKVTMNGINKFGDTNIVEFPKLAVGKNVMQVTGNAIVKMEYYPIYM